MFVIGHPWRCPLARQRSRSLWNLTSSALLSGYNPGRLALTPGTRLGQCEIPSPLGAGRMGKVYRATETKLARLDAIKVVTVSDRFGCRALARFRREAKVLVALNHRSIYVIPVIE